MLEKHLPTVPQSPPAQVEAPPAYESLSPTNNNEGHIRLLDQPTSPPASLATTASPPPAPPRRQAPPAKTHGRSLSSSSTTSVKGKRSWFSFSSSASTTASSRTPDEIRSTILNLLRDLVQEHSSGSPAASGILQSCADACASHNVSLSSILQEPFMEGHTPLYWATVKRSRAPNEANTNSPQSVDVVHAEEPTEILPALISHASPLTPETIKDLRLACLATSDQETFQKLYAMPQLSSISGADQILLGGSISPDDVRVDIGPGTEGAFTAHFEVSQFHKRMMVKKEIVMEFVARNRFWRFAFFIVPDNVWYGPPPGSWCVSISLLESSPPTWFDARLLLLDVPSNPEPSSPPSVLKLKSKQLMEAPRNDAPATQIVVSLNEDPAFSSLQYSGNSYVGTDEKLRVRMEAKLVKSSTYGDV